MTWDDSHMTVDLALSHIGNPDVREWLRRELAKKELAFRQAYSDMRSEQAQRRTAETSHRWWVENYGRPRETVEAENRRLRDAITSSLLMPGPSARRYLIAIRDAEPEA